MSVKNPIYRFVNGVFSKRVAGEPRPKNVNSLEEALEGIAKCGCGVRCCEGSEALLLRSQDAGVIYEIYASGGQLVIKNTENGATSNIVALPSV